MPRNSCQSILFKKLMNVTCGNDQNKGIAIKAIKVRNGPAAPTAGSIPNGPPLTN